MKTLLLMRHAKSDWGDDALPDEERPLNERGRRDAPRMGALLAQLSLVPQLVLTSDAKRARKTARLVAEGCGYEGAIEERGELYLAEPATILELVHGINEKVQCALVIGHNPGFEEFVSFVARRLEPMPTAAIAQIEFAVHDWSQIHAYDHGTLKAVYRPKELNEIA